MTVLAGPHRDLERLDALPPLWPASYNAWLRSGNCAVAIAMGQPEDRGMATDEGYRVNQPARGWVLVLGPCQAVLHLETCRRCANGSPRESYEAEVGCRAEAIVRRDEVCERLRWAVVEWQMPAGRYWMDG